MKKAYIYPISGRDKHLGRYNPYLDDLIISFTGKIDFVNTNDPSQSGIFNIIKYIFRINYIFLNWIENIPERKGGFIQTAFVLGLLTLAKSFKIKIIWTMHNKLSHSKDSSIQKNRIFKKLLKNVDLIITHSSSGIAFGEEYFPGSSARIKYIPHPVKDRRLSVIAEKKQDILIWGTIAPYKGVDKFLEYLHQQNLDSKYKILIVGKISPQEYGDSLTKYQSTHIDIQNSFIEDDQLQEMISESKIILFTYSKSSILSSGVLMDSLGYGANIIAPHVGAFADLSTDNIIKTFSDFPDMIRKIDDHLEEIKTQDNNKPLNKFLEENSWVRFSEKVIKLLDD